MENFIEVLHKYSFLIVIALVLVAVIILFIVIKELILAIVRLIKEYRKEETRETLKNQDYGAVAENEHGRIIRKLACCDGVNPGPLGYLVLDIGGQEVYVRTFTISRMPTMVEFATTFAGLYNFPNCVSSTYVVPIDEAAMSTKLDRHNIVLESEWGVEKNSNRRRRLVTQREEAERWAKQVETGRTKFFNVGFLFSISANSPKELNKQSDLFRAEALGRGIEISNCYTLQSEAFMANAPLNQYLGRGSSKDAVTAFLDPTAAEYHLMDKFSLSTLFNYTQSSFSHRRGVVLGTNLFTKQPVLWNIYDPSHTSFCGLLAGHMGSGKSATIKELCIRNRLFGYRYVAMDGQQRKGMMEGEYAELARLLGGVNFQISNMSNNILNPFDVSESVISFKNEEGRIEERVVLELNNAKIYIATTLLRMITSGKDITDLSLSTYLKKVVTDLVTKLYDNFEIYDGDVHSLFETGSIVVKGNLSSGYVRKALPTMGDFFELAVKESVRNRDRTLDEAYRLTVAAVQDFVRERYYTEESGIFLSRQEYEKLPVREEGRVFSVNGKEEYVRVVRGTRAYYDGQSTLSVDLKTCPFLNIDLSLLQEEEKPIARIIGMGFLNEHVIKKNSEKLSSADKLLVIVDEFHEIIRDAVKTGSESAGSTDNSTVLDMVEGIVLTARKRNVGMLLCSQTVVEWLANKKCEKIIGLMTYAFVFKQPIKDKAEIRRIFGLTEAQGDLIVDYIGGKDERDLKNHRGEACLIDMETKEVCFVKIAYFKQVEAIAVETDAEALSEMFNRIA